MIKVEPSQRTDHKSDFIVVLLSVINHLEQISSCQSFSNELILGDEPALQQRGQRLHLVAVLQLLLNLGVTCLLGILIHHRLPSQLHAVLAIAKQAGGAPFLLLAWVDWLGLGEG